MVAGKNNSCAPSLVFVATKIWVAWGFGTEYSPAKLKSRIPTMTGNEGRMGFEKTETRDGSKTN